MASAVTATDLASVYVLTQHAVAAAKAGTTVQVNFTALGAREGLIAAIDAQEGTAPEQAAAVTTLRNLGLR